MSIRWDVAARAWPLSVEREGQWRVLASDDQRCTMSVSQMYSPYFHFLEKKLQRGAETLWGLVQLHFWLMLGDRQ